MVEILMMVIGAIMIAIGSYILKSGSSNSQFDDMIQMIIYGIYAMEEKYGNGTGEIKKAEVIKWIQSKGFDVTEKDLDIYIDAIVKRLKDSDEFNQIEFEDE